MFCRIRFFQVCKINLTSHITTKEVIYIVVTILVALVVFMSGVNLKTIFTLNGAVLGYIYIILFPIYVHLKCIYSDKSCGFIENDEEWNSKIVPNVCECDNSYSAKWKLYLETVFLILVCILGFGLLLSTVIGVVDVQLIPYHHEAWLLNKRNTISILSW